MLSDPSRPSEASPDGRAAAAEDPMPGGWGRTVLGDPAELADALGLEHAGDLRGREPSALFVRRVPIAYARRWAVLGLASEGDDMPVAVAEPANHETLDVLGRWLGCAVRPLFAEREPILAAIDGAYQRQEGRAQAFIERLGSPDEIDRERVLEQARALGEREDLLDTSGRAPVIQLVNLMLFEAVRERASDVHVQPYERRLVVRLRIDGVLFDAFELPKHLQEEVVSRVKVMGRMNIAEKRLAQDGRSTVQVGDRMIDLRISSIPTSYGERAVIRLLDKSARLYDLAELGMDARTLGRFRNLIGVEHGLILVTGPTGSGKSTTLYAALRQLNSKRSNILTLEDPIEYQLEGISQMQVSDRKGMTFASGLRSVLRQDPDIIMVGEIRDHETAVMAIQSALTGHLVFSTLHTNDAASAITRLLDLGIEPYLAASSMVGVLAQRLVRRVCRSCAASPASPADRVGRLGLDPARVDLSGLREGGGCAACRQTGYRGRMGLFELLAIDEPVRHQIGIRQPASAIKTAALERGMHTLRDEGVAKVLSGATTVEEVVRVTPRD